MCNICLHSPHLPRCPNADEPHYPRCPVCGRTPGTFYADRFGTVVGCERCVTARLCSVHACLSCRTAAETYYIDRFGAIIGCEHCVSPVNWEQIDEIKEEDYAAEL